MKYFSHLRIVAYLICSAPLLVEGCPAVAISHSQTPQADEGQVPSTPPTGAAVFAKICSKKNPPPCATPPRAVFSPAPDYSGQALNAKYEGTCILMIVVSAEGRATNIRVTSSLGMGLDEKAIEAVKRWKFKPAMQDGKPVPVQLAVEVAFHLYQGGVH